MRPAFIQSHETARLVRLFKDMSIDAPMSFSEATKIVGFKITAQLPAYHSARRIAQRDHHVVIDGIRGFGFIRLTGEKVSESGERDLLAVRRRARRGADKQEIALTQNLDHSHMLRSTELLGRFRIIGDTASPARSNRPQVAEPDEAVLGKNSDRLRVIG